MLKSMHNEVYVILIG
jgi:hypothetical protein